MHIKTGVNQYNGDEKNFDCMEFFFGDMPIKSGRPCTVVFFPTNVDLISVYIFL